MSCLITPMEAEENGCRLSPSAYVSEEYDLEIGVTDLDLEVLMCENSKLQAELEEIQDEFVETMGGLLMEKKSSEIRTKHNKLHVGNRAELKGCPVAKVTHKKKDDYMTSLEFTEGVYNQPIKMVTIYFQDGSIRNETPLTEANIES